jgi:hypothetical protein
MGPAAFSPDERMLAVANRMTDGAPAVALVDLATGATTELETAHADLVASLAFSPTAGARQRWSRRTGRAVGHRAARCDQDIRNRSRQRDFCCIRTWRRQAVRFRMGAEHSIVADPAQTGRRSGPATAPV